MSVLNIPITTCREPSTNFEDLLTGKINISKALRSSVSDSQNGLREFLCSEAQRDSSFPRILSESDADFIGGSFGRHTKVKPLDDIDIYLPLDGKGLFYFRDGVIEDCSVLSDNTPHWSRCSDLGGQLVDTFRRRYCWKDSARCFADVIRQRIVFAKRDRPSRFN